VIFPNLHLSIFTHWKSYSLSPPFSGVPNLITIICLHFKNFGFGLLYEHFMLYYSACNVSVVCRSILIIHSFSLTFLYFSIYFICNLFHILYFERGYELHICLNYILLILPVREVYLTNSAKYHIFTEYKGARYQYS
jgi:hypothetical protein